jgi:hypothetical protein
MLYISKRHQGSNQLLHITINLRLIFYLISYTVNWDNAVGIATGYWIDEGEVGVRVPVGSRIFTSGRPHQLWGPPNLLSNGYRELFPGAKAAGA